jgi:hypothetical protein
MSNLEENRKRVPWFVWPFWVIWRLVVTIVELTGRLVAVILGLVLMIVGVIVSLTIVGLIIGVPLFLFGMLLVFRGLF